MLRFGMLRLVVVLGIALVCLALGLAGAATPSTTREEPTKVVPLANLDEAAACVADGPQASTKAAGSTFEPSNAGGCKPCKNQPACACTYQGHPRISCDPCCYQSFPYPICLS